VIEVSIAKEGLDLLKDLSKKFLKLSNPGDFKKAYLAYQATSKIGSTVQSTRQSISKNNVEVVSGFFVNNRKRIYKATSSFNKLIPNSNAKKAVGKSTRNNTSRITDKNLVDFLNNYLDFKNKNI